MNLGTNKTLATAILIAAAAFPACKSGSAGDGGAPPASSQSAGSTSTEADPQAEDTNQKPAKAGGATLKVHDAAEGARYFRVSQFSAREDQARVDLRESARSLAYTTPPFRLAAKVDALQENVTRSWKVGFVQVLTAYRTEHLYQYGKNGWRVPLLPVNDAADGSEFPWYGGARGYGRGYGTANISMSKSINPTVDWFLTQRNGSIDKKSMLTRIETERTYRAWIIAEDEDHKAVYPLKELEYTLSLVIEVNPREPLGKRGFVRSFQASQKARDVGAIEPSWLSGPNAAYTEQFVRNE